MKKFLTFLALACLMVTGAWAQAYQLGSKVTDLANLSAEKLYAIHSTNNEGYWCYNSTINQNYVGITGVKTDGSGVVGNAAANTAYHAAFQPGNVNNQWKITNEDGTYYLYNVGAGQYVTRTDRDYLFTTEKTALDAIHANANGSFAIHAGGGYSGGSTNFACIVTNSTPQAVRNWTSTDHGSMLEFFEIEEISQLQETLNALIATVEEAYAANNEAIWGANLITANSQFSSNATEPNEGSTNNLLDGNLSTFWHSQWSGDYSSKLPHYLQVALNEPISGTVQMTMGRRQGAANDHPMKMSVQYSADGTSYTQADGYMEFSGTTGYVHGTFTLPTDAQYLRFYADETDKNRGYWHCSEFQLKSLFKQAANDQHPTEAAALQNALATAKAVTSATQTDIDNLQAALNTYKAAVDPVKTTITWELYDGTKLVDSESKADCEKDREYTTTLTVPYGYLIEGTKTVTATDENQTIKLNRVADPAFPFQYADSKENIQHWYALNLHCNNKHYAYYSADATPNVQANVTTYQTAPEYAWGFVGNPADGFVIYNKASGTALYSADNNTSCTVGATASTFKATLTGWTSAQADGGFCLNVEGQQYVNFQGDQLKHWGSNDAGSTFHAVELNFSAPKTYAFVLTGPDEKEYEGTFSSNEENPRPACVEGFILSNENWEDVSEYRDDVDYVYTADFEFPFPVSYDGTDGHFTYIYSFKNTKFAWQAEGTTNVKTVQAEEPSGENFVWAIIPAFKDGAFTYKVMNIATQSYIYSTNTTNSHDAGIVTLDEVGSDLTYSDEAFVLPNGYYLSLNSSNKSDGTVQYVGTWGSVHGGVKLMFEEYVPVTSLDITIGETGYATFYDNVTRTIPEGVNAYYCALNEETGNLDAFKINLDYIPRDCGVVLELQEGYNPDTYTFEKSDVVIDWLNPNNDEEIEIGMTDELWGYAEDTSRETAMQEMGMYGFDLIYVLSKVNGQLGFYKYEGETLGAHKAFYATYSEISDEINGFSLDFGGQTVGVSTVISATNLKAGFDIQGRRINKMQKGINILNGKKIIK